MRYIQVRIEHNIQILHDLVQQVQACHLSGSTGHSFDRFTDLVFSLLLTRRTPFLFGKLSRTNVLPCCLGTGRHRVHLPQGALRCRSWHHRSLQRRFLCCRGCEDVWRVVVDIHSLISCPLGLADYCMLIVTMPGLRWIDLEIPRYQTSSLACPISYHNHII